MAGLAALLFFLSVFNTLPFFDQLTELATAFFVQILLKVLIEKMASSLARDNSALKMLFVSVQ